MTELDIPTPGSSEWSLPRNGRQKEVRRRQRQMLSCLPCRRLKVKCDRERPCGHCVWSERAASCRYAAFPRSTANAKSLADGSSGEDHAKASKATDPPIILPKSKPLLFPKSQQPQNSNSEAYSSPISDSIPSTDLDASSREKGPARHQHGAYDPRLWKSKFRGATHWSNILRQFEFGRLHRPTVEQAFHATKGYFCQNMPSNYPVGLGYQSYCPSKSEILTYVPERRRAMPYIENYLETIERTHPLLHGPTFRDELRRFWVNPTAVDDGWLGQLLVMLALGYETNKGEVRGLAFKDTEEEVIEKLLRGAETCLKSTSFLFAPTLTSLRTLSMMVLAKRTRAFSCLESDACGPLMSTIVRLAMSIGLHCDPRDEDSISPFDKEIRRRVWTTIAYMEIQISLSTGMPLLLRSSDFNTQPPANINDEDLSPSVPQHISIRPSMEYTDSTFQIILARSFDIASDVVSRANSPAGVFEYDQVLRQGADIKQLLYETSQVYDWRASAKGEDWKYLQKFMLEIFLRRVLLVLHSYYGLKDEAHLKYPESYWSTLECSLALLVLQRQISEDLGIPKARVWLAEFFKHDFYTATLIVSLQVSRNDALGADGGMRHQGIEMPPRQTILQTLQCCREISARRICRSHCHFMIHTAIGSLIAKLESQYQNGISPHIEQMAIQESLKALKECQCGNCSSRRTTLEDFHLNPGC